MKVTINPLKTGPVEMVLWQISEEPPRVSVETENYSYSIVMAPEGPYIEVWELDQNGEHSSLIKTINLPN